MADDRSDDTAAASAEQLKASVAEAIGKLTGDARTEAEGRRRKRDADTPANAEPGTPEPGSPKPAGTGRR